MVEQVTDRLLDFLVVVLRRPLLAVDEGGAVDLLEVPVGEAVAPLGLVGRLSVDGQVPAAVAVIALALDNLVAVVRGRRGVPPAGLGIDGALVDHLPSLLNRCLVHLVRSHAARATRLPPCRTAGVLRPSAARKMSVEGSP